MDKIKVVVRKILRVLLIAWMILVFCLSNQNGPESSNLSRKVANFFANGDTVRAEKIEPVVRKAAHMSEYGVGAMIFYGITMTYTGMSRKKKIIISFVFVILYASSDELHQLFINERNGSVKDVIIDTCGSALGILAMFIVERAMITIDNKVQENLKNQK